MVKNRKRENKINSIGKYMRKIKFYSKSVCVVFSVHIPISRNLQMMSNSSLYRPVNFKV